MNAWALSFIFALGGGTWIWVMLVKKNGNSDPKVNYLVAGGVGIFVFLFFISLLKLVLHLN